MSQKLVKVRFVSSMYGYDGFVEVELKKIEIKINKDFGTNNLFYGGIQVCISREHEEDSEVLELANDFRCFTEATYDPIMAEKIRTLFNEV